MKKNAGGKTVQFGDKSRFASLTLLKKSSTFLPSSPQKAGLEVFKNLYPERRYEVVFECPEFTSQCPVTGQPDFGEITIRYVPGRYCVESKSLKLFLFSFRNLEIFHEEAVNLILEKIVEVADPVFLEVTGKFRPRGGISINVRAEHRKD